MRKEVIRMLKGLSYRELKCVCAFIQGITEGKYE